MNRTFSVKNKALPRLHQAFFSLGTSAGSLDEGFDSTGNLEIFKVDVSDTNENIEPLGSIKIKDKFQSLAWGADQMQMGIIAGGMPDGTINFYDPAAITEGKDGAEIGSAKEHNGPITVLDFNPIQPNLMASGSNASEFLIWQLKDPQKPTAMLPGETENIGDLTVLKWNRSVAHILATTSDNGITTVYDLRSKKSLITVRDLNKARCRAMDWSPSNATQLITAPADDKYPVVNLWDLRKGVEAPVAAFSGHSKGIWSLSWSGFDENLFLSSSRDNTILCWDIRNQQILSKTHCESWTRDVQWSTRMPALFSACSVDGEVSVHSISDPISPSQGALQNQSEIFNEAPNWMKVPCGVSFCFGGKCVSFNAKDEKEITLSSVSNNPVLVQRSTELQDAIKQGNLTDYCDKKIRLSQDDQDECDQWKFVRALLEDNRSQLLSLLDYDKSKITAAIESYRAELAESKAGEEDQKEEDADEAEESIEKTAGQDEEDEADKIENEDGDNDDNNDDDVATEKNDDEAEGDATSTSFVSADLFGGETGDNPFAFVTPPQNRKNTFDLGSSDAPEEGEEDNNSDFASLLNVGTETQTTAAFDFSAVPEVVRSVLPITFKFESEASKYLTNALILGDFEAAVDLCFQTENYADALIIASVGGDDLRKVAQDRYFALMNKKPYLAVAESIFREDLADFVSRVSLDNWKSGLAVLCSFADREEFMKLCNSLGNRLLQDDRSAAALLCFTCSANFDRIITTWTKRTGSTQTSEQLADLVEKLAILSRTFNTRSYCASLTSLYGRYANLLASEGLLDSALHYLLLLQENGGNVSGDAAVMMDRVYNSLPYKPELRKPPQFPFSSADISECGAATAPVKTAVNTTTVPVVVDDIFGKDTSSEFLVATPKTEVTQTEPKRTVSEQQPSGTLNTGATTPAFITEAAKYNTGTTGASPFIQASSGAGLSTGLDAGLHNTGTQQQTYPLGGNSGMPPVTTTSHAGTPPPPTEQSAAPEKQKPPVPQASEASLQLVAAFTALFQALETSGVPGKSLSDAKHRLTVKKGNLFSIIKEGKVTDAESSLISFVQAANTRDKAKTKAILTQLTSKHWKTIGSTNMVGLKRLTALI